MRKTFFPILPIFFVKKLWMRCKPIFEAIFMVFSNFSGQFSCIFPNAAVTQPCLPLCFLLLYRTEPGLFCLYTFPKFAQEYPSLWSAKQTGRTAHTSLPKQGYADCTSGSVCDFNTEMRSLHPAGTGARPAPSQLTVLSDAGLPSAFQKPAGTGTGIPFRLRQNAEKDSVQYVPENSMQTGYNPTSIRL